MEPITISQILEATGGEILGTAQNRSAVITAVDTDSRRIRPGSLFVPLVGDRFDGHAYINSALEAGAVACLTSYNREACRPDRFYIKVEDTEKALGALAAWYRKQFDIPFIGVTGSVGKTTCKDMIAAVLGAKYRVLKTEGNHNNNVGMPLTLLNLDHTAEICVLEMGMDKFGEIDYLSGIVEPDMGVITNIGDAHIERLGSRENIFKAKCEMLPHLKKDGLLILNGDDPLLATLRGRTPVETVFCGKTEGLDYQAQVTGGDGETHIHCRIRTPHMDREVCIPALGQHMVYPVLIAVALAERLGLTPEEIEQGISSFVPTRMRMNIIRRADNMTILDDTYNANPQSMRAAISVLSDSRSSWKVAILGDMLELGPFAPTLHNGVGCYLGKVHADCLIAVGDLAEHIAKGAINAGVPAVYHFRTREEAKNVLKDVIRPDSTYLVKASRGMRMEEMTEALLALTKPEEHQ